MFKDNIRYILPENGNLYKANLHTHTTVSDGKFTPEQIKEMYKARGYHAVAYTDHRECVPHRELTDGGFVALTGIEQAFGIGRDTSVHVCAISRDESTAFKLPDEPDDSVEEINRGIANLNSRGFITTLNHPRWSGISYEDITKIEGVSNMELVNGFEMIQDGYGDSSAIYELELRRGRRAYPIAADDSHRMSKDGGAGPEYFRGFSVIMAEELTYSALIEALDAGHFYASTGPLFKKLYLVGDILHVECSAVSGVYVHADKYKPRAAVVDSCDCIEAVDIDVGSLLRESSYIYVNILDSRGKCAWAPPFWIDK